jgi:hypothetical protein
VTFIETSIGANHFVDKLLLSQRNTQLRTLVQARDDFEDFKEIAHSADSWRLKPPPAFRLETSADSRY